MRKTSVYLTNEESEALRRAATTSGKAQSELIREGVRRVIVEVGDAPRIFRSMGAGQGGGAPYRRWSAADVYRKVMGDR